MGKVVRDVILFDGKKINKDILTPWNRQVGQLSKEDYAKKALQWGKGRL